MIAHDVPLPLRDNNPECIEDKPDVVPEGGVVDVLHVDINTKTYEIKRSVDKDYERRLRWQIIFDPNLPKWNYLVKPLN